MSIQIVEIAQPSVIDTVAVAQPSTVAVVEVRQGPAGPAGTGGDVIIDADTQSDGTANLSLANVTTATAEVTGTLTAPHIHGNLAGSLYAHVRAGENLAKGDPVYVSGSHGSGATLIAEVSKADASNAAKMPAVGIMDAAVSAQATGHMVISGTITEFATNAYSINAELYVAAGGGLTATPPTARAQPVARVERSNLNNGAILVKVNGLSASDATGNTLVRRTSNGSASFGDINAASLNAGNIEATSLLQTAAFESTGNAAFQGSVEFQTTDYAYGTGAAEAHRTALGSGATGDALFTAASKSTALSQLGVSMAYKSSSEQRTNTATYADDSTLVGLALDANSEYLIEALALVTCDAACGLKHRLVFPVLSGANGGNFLQVSSNGSSFGNYTIPSGTGIGADQIRTAASSAYSYRYFGYVSIGATAGTLKLQWAQNTLNNGANAQIDGRSWLRVTKIYP